MTSLGGQFQNKELGPSVFFHCFLGLVAEIHSECLPYLDLEMLYWKRLYIIMTTIMFNSNANEISLHVSQCSIRVT